MYQIDLNCDLGESFGRYTLGMDADILPLVSSANVACGYHASDPLVMNKTIAMAKEALGDKLTGNIVKEIYVPGRIVNIVVK